MRRTRVLRKAEVLAVAVSIAALAGCGGKEAVDPETLRRGASLFRDWGCDLCHGPAREGGELGPPLADIADRWTEERLAAYLLDPEAFLQEDAHLQELETYYPEASMPAFDYPEEDRRAVAAWLLNPPPTD